MYRVQLNVISCIIITAQSIVKRQEAMLGDKNIIHAKEIFLHWRSEAVYRIIKTTGLNIED